MDGGVWLAEGRTDEQIDGSSWREQEVQRAAGRHSGRTSGGDLCERRGMEEWVEERTGCAIPESVAGWLADCCCFFKMVFLLASAKTVKGIRLYLAR